MSNYIEYNNKIAFHPGYYIKEIIEESGLTQEDFAKRLDTTPKNLSLLIRGEQNLSVDMAIKLSRMLDTSISYWLNLQNAYDALKGEFKSNEELKNENRIFRYLDYSYFKENFNLPNLPRKTNDQIIQVRKFLKISTLAVLTKKDMAVSFRSANTDMTEANIVKANTMVQIATNKAMLIDAPKFNKSLFEKAVEYALTLTEDHATFYPKLFRIFKESGVIFIILPNISGSKTNGATKKIGENIMLMVNDRRLNSDSFWFTLFHEIGHIFNGDFGISFENESGTGEESANKFAQDKLIPPVPYSEFVRIGKFNPEDICSFAKQIGRDPGIVLGRLQNDGLVRFNDWKTKPLRCQYTIKTHQ